MKRPTEAQAARIEAKIERMRIDAQLEMNAGRFGRGEALTREADRLWHEYIDACGVSEIIRGRLARSLIAPATAGEGR